MKEVLQFKIEKTPHIITRLYDKLNKPDLCDYCRKEARVLRVEIGPKRKLKIYKLCHECLLQLYKLDKKK